MFCDIVIDEAPVDAEMFADHSVVSTLITASLASTMILSIGNEIFSHVRALKTLPDARTCDHAWPKWSLRNIVNDFRSDTTRTEKIIVVFSGLGLANVVVVVWLFVVVTVGFMLYVFHRMCEAL